MSSSASSATWTCKKCFCVFDDYWWIANHSSRNVIEEHIKNCKGTYN